MYTFVLLCLAVFAGSSYGEPVEMTHLVTMRKAELMEIINCVSMSRNPTLCQKFARCESLMADQVIVAYERCQKAILHGRRRQCNTKVPLFPSPEIPSMIFDCIVQNVRKLTPEERGEMVQFEVCSRKLYEGYCETPKYYF